MEKSVVSKIVDSVLKEAVNINELSSGHLRSREAIEKSWNVMRGNESVEVGSKAYMAKGPIKGTQLKKGMIVLATFNQVNQGTGLYEILGVTDWDPKYGEGGVKFNSVKDAMRSAGVVTLKDLDEKTWEKAKAKWGTDEGYGHEYKLVVKDLVSKDSGPWFYLFKGRWSRGSGAEKLSFVLMEETSLSATKAAASVKKAQEKTYRNFGEMIANLNLKSFPASDLAQEDFGAVIVNFYAGYFAATDPSKRTDFNILHNVDAILKNIRKGARLQLKALST